jgi:hypothetical protein
VGIRKFLNFTKETGYTYKARLHAMLAELTKGKRPKGKLTKQAALEWNFT